MVENNDVANEGLELEIEEEKNIEDRILLLLEVYPIISPTMMQAGLGPQTAPAKWRPVLDRLLTEGRVKQDTDYRQNVSGQYRTYIRLGLAKNIA